MFNISSLVKFKCDEQHLSKLQFHFIKSLTKCAVFCFCRFLFGKIIFASSRYANVRHIQDQIWILHWLQLSVYFNSLNASVYLFMTYKMSYIVLILTHRINSVYACDVLLNDQTLFVSRYNPSEIRWQWKSRMKGRPR